MEADGGVRDFSVVPFSSPFQDRSGSQISWARVLTEPEKLGLLGHSRFRVFYSFCLFMYLNTRHTEVGSNLWIANTLLLGVATPLSLCSLPERLLLSIGGCWEGETEKGAV